MVCPYCQHNDTAVVNSRQHKIKSQIWRRRQCVRCKTTFTTYEYVAQKELPMIHGVQNNQPFSRAKLLISIHTHLPKVERSSDDADALVDSIYESLLEHSSSSLTTRDIADATYTILSRFNPQSGLSYAVKHNIITPNTRL